MLRKAQDFLERSVKASEEDSEVVSQSTFWARTITWSLIGTTAFGIGWLAVARTEEIVIAPGKLEPIGAVKDISLPVGGVVDKILVQEGQKVSKGQPLLRLDTEASADRKKNLNQTIALKEQQLASKAREEAEFLAQNSSQQKFLETTLGLEQVIENRFKTLAQEGASAELQFLQQKNKVQELRGSLEQARLERFRQQAIFEQANQQLRTELSDLRSKLTELDVNIRYQELRSPVEGVVFELKPRSPGFVAQSVEPMMKVVPFDKLEARVEVNSADIGFVSVNRPVEISIDSFPATDFGVVHGTVRRIGSDALPPDQLHNNYRFPVAIKLQSQVLKTQSGQSLPLQVGMSLTANIKLRQVSYLQLLVGSFRSKAESLRRI